MKLTKNLKIRIPKMTGPLKIVTVVDASFGNRRGEPSYLGYLIYLVEANAVDKMVDGELELDVHR